MIKLIIGVKGSGKTKTLIEMVHKALSETKGDVVCIEKGDKLRFDIKYQCRLVDTDQYLVTDAVSLYGFVAGILASNHDVSDLFRYVKTTPALLTNSLSRLTNSSQNLV